VAAAPLSPGTNDDKALQTVCAGYAIPAETLLSPRTIHHQLTGKLEKKGSSLLDLCQIGHFRV